MLEHFLNFLSLFSPVSSSSPYPNKTSNLVVPGRSSQTAFPLSSVMKKSVGSSIDGVGSLVGELVGTPVGALVGVSDRTFVGVLVGVLVGGKSQLVGAAVGGLVGCGVGGGTSVQKEPTLSRS